MPEPVTCAKGGSLKPRPYWDKIFPVADEVAGKCVEKYRVVLEAFERGELGGPVPKFNAFWRRITVREEGVGADPDTSRAAAASITGDAGELASKAHPLATVHLSSPAAGIIGIHETEPSPDGADPRLAALHTVREAEPRLTRAAARLSAMDLFSSGDTVDLRRVLKKGKAGRLAKHDAEGLLRLAGVFNRFAEQYLRRLAAAGHSDPGIAPLRALQLPEATPDTRGTTLPLERVGSGSVSEEPEYRAVVGHVRLCKSERDARLRSRIVAPVLNGALSAHDCAAAIRSLAAGNAPDAQAADLFGCFPAVEYAQYRNISGRTVQRWAKRVRTMQARAAATVVSPPPITEILMHQQPKERLSKRKVTPDVERLMIDTFKNQPNFTKANVAVVLRETLGVELSGRHVQRILAAQITDVERGMARGGIAADVLFRAKLFRDARRPNETWIGDHSFLRQEHLDPDHPEFRDGTADFNWECEVAVERRSRFGVVARERRQMHLTMWIDAFSRRVLAIRVWDTAPTTQMTLASLSDAVRQFGLPERIYTDNGSDFRSREMQEAVIAVGIGHAFSRPYSPEGRGSIERGFRTIKEKVMPHIPGYVGGRHPRVWSVEDLLTPEELEERIWYFIDRYMNEVPHSATKRRPSEHYDAHIGVRDLSGLLASGASTAPFLRLLPVERRVLQPFGVEWGALPYWCGAMCLLPHRTEVHVHYEPLRWRHVYISVPDAGGALRFLGRADAYDLESPPPDIAETLSIEASWREHILLAESEWSETRAHRALVTDARNGGENMAAAVADAVDGELSRIDSPPKLRLLGFGEAPTGSPSPEVRFRVPPVDPTAASTPAALLEDAVQRRSTIRPRRPASAIVVNPLE
jgi:transposase InsO family protein